MIPSHPRPKSRPRAGGIAAALALALLAPTVLGCAETSREVLARLTPAYRNKRSDVARIAELLPPAGSVRRLEVPAKLSPPIVIDESSFEINTDVLPVEVIVDPEKKGQVTDFWIYPNRLVTCMLWTGPRNPLHPDAMDSAAGEGVRGCEGALGQPYVLAVRTLVYDLPNEVALEAFLVDLRSRRVLGQFPLSYRDRSVDQLDPRGDYSARRRDGAASAFWEIMHCGLVEALERFPSSRVRVHTGCRKAAARARLEPLGARPTLIVADPSPRPEPRGE